MRVTTRTLRRIVEVGKPFAWTGWSAIILGRLDLQPGMAVLDVGCGRGRVAVPAAKRVGDTGEVVAVDPQPGVLRRARRKARRAQLANIDFVGAPIINSSVEHNHFDRALMVSVLGDTLERMASLKATFNALKPGGMLSVTEHIFDPHFQTRDTVMRLAETSGFRVKKFSGSPIAYTVHFEKPRAQSRPVARNASPARPARRPIPVAGTPYREPVIRPIAGPLPAPGINGRRYG